jgi:hypothetical protein
VTLFTKPAEPAAPSLLYQVAWVDKDGGKHANRGLTWREACTAYNRLDHIVGNYRVRIAAQGGAG